MSGRVVTVYGRPGCSLCDEAVARIRALTDEQPVEIRDVDIERDEALHRELFEVIPVVEVDGRRLSKLIEYRGEAFAERLRSALAS